MVRKRITVSLDEDTLDFLGRMSSERNVSQSELVRKSVEFLHENSEYGDEDLEGYLEILSGEEMVLLDIDHWLVLLDLVRASEEREDFWRKVKKISNMYADQISEDVEDSEKLLKRLELCNFYNLEEISENEYTLGTRSEPAKKFVKKFLENISISLGFDIEIEEEIGKLRVKI